MSTEAKAATFLERRGYRFAELLKRPHGKIVARVQKDGNDYLFKTLPPPALRCHTELLSAIGGVYGDLVVPQCIEHGQDGALGPWVILPFYKGRTFPHTVGGGGISTDSADVALKALRGLVKLDAGALPRPVAEWLSGRDRVQPDRIRRNLEETAPLVGLEGKRRRQAEDVLEPCLEVADDRTRILSNGDFHIRNLIDLPTGKVALIDWNTAVSSPYELEWCAAYHWIIMFFNAEWQSQFLKGAQATFDIAPDVFRAVLLAVALHQARGWSRNNLMDKVDSIAREAVAGIISDPEYPLSLMA